MSSFEHTYATRHLISPALSESITPSTWPAAKRVFKRILRATIWMIIAGLSYLLLLNIWAYLDYGSEHPFVVEKLAEGLPLIWIAALILHIPAAALCIAASLIQLSSWAQRRLPKVHRYSGRAYAYSVILIIVPTGLILGLYAKGGLLGIAAFWVMGIMALVSTILGIVYAKRREFATHKHWMWRSYAMIATALSFRVYHIIFYYMGMQADTNYLLALWLSVIGNAFIAEAIIRKDKMHK